MSIAIMQTKSTLLLSVELGWLDMSKRSIAFLATSWVHLYKVLLQKKKKKKKDETSN